MKLTSLEQTTKELNQIVKTYNQCRPHGSLDMNTPEFAHNQSGDFKKHWKNYYYNAEKAELKISSFASPNKAMAKL
jgi:hypothetical protein